MPLMTKRVLGLLLIVSAVCVGRPGGATPVFRDAPSFDRVTEIPARMAAGQNGYLILASEAVVGELKQLEAFKAHKEKLGFKVHVVHSGAWGGGQGLQSVSNIRKWLVAHYKDLDLLYVLLIGNPNPETGDIAHAATALAWTDWPYMDLDSPWEKVMRPKASKAQRNGKEAAPEGLYVKGVTDISDINGQWDVLVGRIPWYGPESTFWKAADVDAILARTMRYENDKRDTSWRFNYTWSEHGDGSKKMPIRRICDDVGANYVRLWHDFGDTAPTDGAPNRVKDVMNSLQEEGVDPTGFVYYHSHGGGESVCGTIHTKGVIDQLRDDYPAIHWFGACSVGTPRNDRNIVGAIFRYNGIASIGPSMSVASFKPDRTRIEGSLYTGQSIGEHFWNKAKAKSHGEQGISGLNKTTLCYYLHGDPSVVPFRQRHGAYLQVSPYAAQYDKVVGAPSPIRRTYTIANNTDQAMAVTLRSSAPWLVLSVASITLPPRKATDIVAAIDPAHPDVVHGSNRATIRAVSSGLSRTVDYTLEKTLSMQTYCNTMDAPVRGHRKSKDEKESGLAVSGLTKGRFSNAIVLDTPLNLAGRGRKMMIPGYNSFTLSFWFKDQPIDAPAPDGPAEPVSYASEEERKAAASAARAAQKSAKRSERKLEKKLEKNRQVGIARKIMTFGGAWTISISEEGNVALDIVENKFMLPRDQEGALASRAAMREQMRTSEEWSDYHVEGPPYDGDAWTHVAFSLDRRTRRVLFYVNGKLCRSEDELSFEVPLLTVAKTYVTLQGTPGAPTAFDELRFFNHAVSVNTLKQLCTGRAPDHTFLPFPGDRRPPDQAALVWRTVDASAKRVLEYATAPTFADATRVNVSGQTSHVLDGLDDGRTYFWRVISRLGGVVVASTPSWFSTDKDVVIRAPVVGRRIDKKPPAFAIGDQGASVELSRYVHDTEGDTLSYELLKGPSWLTLTPEGVLFTPFGPRGTDTEGAKIAFRVTDQTGLSVEREAAVKVVAAPPQSE